MRNHRHPALQISTSRTGSPAAAEIETDEDEAPAVPLRPDDKFHCKVCAQAAPLTLRQRDLALHLQNELTARSVPRVPQRWLR